MNDVLLVTIGAGAAPGPSLEGNLWKIIENDEEDSYRDGEDE